MSAGSGRTSCSCSRTSRARRGPPIRALRLRADLARSRERLVLAREEERRRLRRDLHDGLGPSLASIGLRAEASAEMLTTDPEAAKRLLDELGDEVQTTLADIRRLVDGLRPPALDELGLIGAIEQQASRLEGAVGERPPTTISLVATPDPLPGLPAAVEVAAYRIVVEALTNAVRHAEARTCQVRLTVGRGPRHRGRRRRSRATRAGRGRDGLESMEARAVELGGIVAHRPGSTWRDPSGGPPPYLRVASAGARGGGRCHRGDPLMTDPVDSHPRAHRRRPRVVPVGPAGAARDGRTTYRSSGRRHPAPRPSPLRTTCSRTSCSWT